MEHNYICENRNQPPPPLHKNSQTVKVKFISIFHVNHLYENSNKLFSKLLSKFYIE